MLMHVKCTEPKGHIRLQFRCKALLYDIVAALQEKIVKRVEVSLSKVGRCDGDKCYAKQAAKLVSTRTSCDSSDRFFRIEKREFIPFQTFNMFKHQIKVLTSTNAKLLF